MGGTVTAGNASGVNDGASAIVVMSQLAEERGLEPLGVVESYASVGVEPRVMAIGPIRATRKALEKVGGRRGRRSLRAQRGLRGAVARRP
jgi:acetyl-CoA C-acetyltransferase